jgi:hypothetical protein
MNSAVERCFFFSRVAVGALLVAWLSGSIDADELAPAKVHHADGDAAHKDSLEAAARLIEASEAASREHIISTTQLASCFAMARDVRLAIAHCRHDRAARRQALEEHIRLLWRMFDKFEAVYKREPFDGGSPNDLEPLALVGCRLAQACADLSVDLGLPAARVSNLKAHVEWADWLAYASTHSYHTESLRLARVILEARGEPYLARVELARAMRDCQAQRRPWADFLELADQESKLINALHSENAMGGEEEHFAFAMRTVCWIQAERARLVGDRRQELRHRREAVAWSQRMATAYDAAFRDRQTWIIDCWLAQRELESDRLALAGLCADCCAAQHARTELLRSATALYRYVRDSRSRRDDGSYELEFAHCAQTLAQMRFPRQR